MLIGEGVGCDENRLSRSIPWSDVVNTLPQTGVHTKDAAVRHAHCAAILFYCSCDALVPYFQRDLVVDVLAGAAEHLELVGFEKHGGYEVEDIRLAEKGVHVGQVFFYCTINEFF